MGVPARLLSFLLLSCVAGCYLTWTEMGVGVGGVAGGYVVSELIRGRGKCGALQKLSAREFQLGFSAPQAASQLSGQIKIAERPLAAVITASEINFYNMVSVVCALQREAGLPVQVGTEWLKIAAGPRIELETLMGSVTSSTRTILGAFGVRQDELKTLIDSIACRTRADPATTWVELTAAQNMAIEDALRYATAQSAALKSENANTATALASLHTVTAQQAEQLELLRSYIKRQQYETDSVTAGWRNDVAQDIELVRAAADEIRARRYLEVFSTTEVRFAFNSTLIPDSTASRIRQLANEYRSPHFSFSLVGSADPSGATTYNLELSQRRAGAVQRVLLAAGIPPTRIAVGAYGDALNPGGLSSAELRRVLIMIHAAPQPR